MDKARAIKLIASILICQAAGLVGSVFTAPNIPTWYAGLNKPAFNPPNWLFAPVWTTLFALMGISLFLVWDRGLDRNDVRSAVYVFGAQLVLNVLWSFMFFGLQSPLLGLLEIILLWISILVTMTLFYRINMNAAYLLAPYILWVSFAAFLNYSIWVLNL